MAMVDERQMRSQWRRVCVDQCGRKKRVGYWIGLLGKDAMRRLELGAWGAVVAVAVAVSPR